MSAFLQFIFITVAIFLIITMYMTWTVEKTMQASYWLILFLVGISILFLIANSEIMFAFQLSIYGGGISVLLLFAALLAQHDDYLFVGDSIFGKIQGLRTQISVFLILAINLILLPVLAITNTNYNTENSVLGDSERTVSEAFLDTARFSHQLWTEYSVVIPFLSLLLLTALLGSIKLVIREWELEELSDIMKMRYETKEDAQ